LHKKRIAYTVPTTGGNNVSKSRVTSGGNPFTAKSLSVCVATLALALTGCFLFPTEEKMLEPPVLLKPPETVFRTAPVRRDTIELTVNGPATFVPMVQEDQYFSYGGGRVQNVYIEIGDSVERGDLLMDLFTGNLADEIDLQRIALQKASLRAEKTRALDASRVDIDLASLDVRAEELKLSMLVRRLEDSRLYASMSGEVVLLSSRFSPGSYVNAFDTVARIADPARLELRYTGARVFDFTVGAQVSVRLENEDLVGIVVKSPATAPPDAAEAERRTVFIRLADLPDYVRSGDLAQVTLTLDQRQNVVVIPRDALREYLGRRYVYVLVENTRQERTVEVGLETPVAVEIVAGLDEGEAIILR
jgi:membrane fusion protein, macrolide-specific efflux system